MNSLSKAALFSVFFFAIAAPAIAQTTKLTIESWRNDDLLIWQEKILPVFHKEHPDIDVTFTPTVSPQYNAALNAKLDSHTAGDLITCRPFDISLNMFQRGQLADLTQLPGINNFTRLAKTAWSTDDGKSTFCVPMAAVLHGFIYNKDTFKKLGLTPPTTQDQFFKLLDAIKKDGTYTPLAMGTSDEWGTATMGYQNIGPTFWKGEAGRKALLNGTQKLTDADWVKPFEVIKRWATYMGNGYQARSYSDSQNMFTLGRAAIYPGGSFEIAPFESQGVDFAMGAFPPPVDKNGKCYVTDHPDIAMGMNAKTPHPEAARIFLSWVASDEFSQLYANALPGFFPLSKAKVKITDPLALDFMKMRTQCESTIRPFYQILSRGNPSTEELNKVVSAAVINGTLTPQDAAKRMQASVEWYGPQKEAKSK